MKVWWSSLVVTLDTGVEEKEARLILLDSLRRKAEEMKPEDLQLGQCEQGARLVIMNPGERKVKFTTPPEKP